MEGKEGMVKGMGERRVLQSGVNEMCQRELGEHRATMPAKRKAGPGIGGDAETADSRRGKAQGPEEVGNV